MLKKILAGLTTLALALGMVALTAVPASAHHNTIESSVACSDDYKYTVTWTITNSERYKDETITASSDTALVPVGTIIPAGQKLVVSETFNAPADKTLTLSAAWTGATSTDSGTVKERNFPTKSCEPQHVQVYICHANNGVNGWNYIKVDDDSIVKSSGHDSHEGDIIPAFTYWEKVSGVWTEKYYPGKNLTTDFQGFTGQQLLDSRCDMEVVATAPTVQATCSAPGVPSGSYTIPSTPGVTYSVKLPGSSQYVTQTAGTYPAAIGAVIKFKAASSQSWVELSGKTSWELTVPDPGDCIVTVAPVEPTINQITVCGTYGSINYPTTTGVVYTLTSGDGKQGAYTVTATPAFGYEFVGAQSVEFKGNLGTYTDCATPVAPKVTVIQTCGTYGKIELPTTDGVVYALTSGDGKQGAYTVTATPAPGYSFVGDQVVEFKGDLGTYTTCAIPLPATFANGNCSASDQGGQLPGQFTIPTKTGVQYSVSFDGGTTYTDYLAGTYDATNGSTVMVKATALPTYSLVGTSEWSHTFDVKFCPPTEADYEVFLSSANQACTTDGGVTSGSVTVSVIAGPEENPVPAVFILNKGTASEQTITGTTQLPPGNYTVTALPKLAKDAVYSSTGSSLPKGGWLWPVTIGAASTFDCLELTTLAYTGTSLAVGGFALAGGLVVLGGIILVMRRREHEHSA